MKRKLFVIGLLFVLVLNLVACGGPTTTTCYWCGKEEECYQYCLQKLDGYNPNGSFKYDYDYEYMSSSCAAECKSSGRYINVEKAD